MTDDTLPLAAEFPAATQQRWRKLTEAALKGANFDKRLVSQTYDGLRVEPLYPRAAGARSVAGRKAGQAWTVMQRIDHPDPAAANVQILDDLENGATGLTLVFAGSLNANGFGLPATPDAIARTLKDVALDAITFDFNLSSATRDAVQHFAALVRAQKLDPAKVDMRASLNPIGGLAATGTAARPWKELAPYLAKSIRDFVDEGYRGPLAVADGRIIHNAGGSEAQELAFSLAAGVELLRALEGSGLALDAARQLIYFRLAADADEFLTIAKFRAVRKLWARVETACGLPPQPAVVHAETAWRMMTKRDPYVNMLRATIAVTAAGVGGADAISVLPHTAALGLPDPFARRVARNIQLVLLEESNLDKTADPAAGCGAIERLTDDLCTAAWSQFQAIETAGGAWAALEKGLIQSEVGKVRAAREAAVARRKDAITGTSDYPNLHEQLPAVLAAAPAPRPAAGPSPTVEPLPNIRLAEPFEALRDRSDEALAKSGRRPKVFLATLGKPSDFTARATFAKNFYEAGGIEAVIGDGYTSTDDMASAFRQSGAKLACLCSSDQQYKTAAVEAATALKRAGAHIHLAGRPGPYEAEWQQVGIETFIYVGCDALATLRAAHDILLT